VICFGAVGDLVRMTAPLRALADRWGAACDLVADHRGAPLVLKGLHSVDRVRPFTTRRWPYWSSPEQWRLVTLLAEHRRSPVYVYEQRRHPWAPWTEETRIEALLRRAGVPRDHIVTLRDCPRADVEHTLAHWLRVAAHPPPALRSVSGGGRAAAPAPTPELAVDAAEIEEARRRLAEDGWRGEPIVAFQTTSRRAARGRWPAERWTALAREILHAEPAARLLLLGTSDDRSGLEALADQCADGRVRVATQFGLRLLFAVLSLSHSLISLDTGPAHIAAAVGCPLVVIAGRADPRRHRPVGRAPVRVVTGFDGGEWPPHPQAWWDRHDTAMVTVAAVSAAWHGLADR
jgi:heptosyltransferase-2/heptosyltransferase-3